MKIEKGIVHIFQGDSLDGVHITGAEVRIDTEREIREEYLDQDVIDILLDMDVSMAGGKIRGCRIITTGEIANRAADRAIRFAKRLPKESPQKKTRAFSFWRPWKKGGQE